MALENYYWPWHALYVTVPTYFRVRGDVIFRKMKLNNAGEGTGKGECDDRGGKLLKRHETISKPW